jgi:predicted RNA-binding protein YlxR (DUF448 family)
MRWPRPPSRPRVVVASRPGGGPRRTCVGCRTVRAQGGLVRIALDERGGLAVNPRRVTGRSAYLCPSPACLEQALRRNALSRALRVQVPGLDLATLRDAVLSEAAQVSGTPVAGSGVSH